MNKSLIKSSATIGGLAGFFFILLFTTLFVLATPLTAGLYYADLGLMAFFIFITLIYFRDYNNYQEMGFVEGLLSGGISTLVSSLLLSIFIFVLMSFIVPDALSEDVKSSIKSLMNESEEGVNYYIEKYGQEAFDQQLNSFKNATIGQLIIKKIFSLSIVGFIFSVVFAIFLRKKHDVEA